MAYPEVQAIFQSAAGRYGIDWNIGYRQINRESGFNPRARGAAGEMGAAQFMPGTWARFGSGDPFNPVASADAWGKYMSYLLGLFHGRYDVALAGYNWGESRQVLRDAAASDQDVRSFNIPSGVKSYVNGILGNAGAPAPSLPSPGGAIPTLPSQSSSVSPVLIAAIGFGVFLLFR